MELVGSRWIELDGAGVGDGWSGFELVPVGSTTSFDFFNSSILYRPTPPSSHRPPQRPPQEQGPSSQVAPSAAHGRHGQSVQGRVLRPSPRSSCAMLPARLPARPVSALAVERVRQSAIAPPGLHNWEGPSRGFWRDLGSMRWMRHPGTSFRMMLVFLLPWSLVRLAHRLSWLASSTPNPLSCFVQISYPLALRSVGEGQRYDKGPRDLLFLAFYVIVFSFVRQSVTEFIVRPFAIWLRLRGSKQDRFVEQGYAVFYWGSSTLVGLYVMSQQSTWWYKTSEFWVGYPHYRMKASLKAYYLLQLSYWLHQMLVLTLRMEKPRSDFTELIVHHIVTLWLVGWSYLVNLTMIGTAIFVSMDISDTLFGLSKCINYTKYKRTSEASFAIFLAVWTYFRHWQNLRILYSVYYEFEALVPQEAKRWSPSNNVFLAGWMKWQIFGPILMLQVLNLFWYFLIWRIVYRMVIGQNLVDVREEGETDDDEDNGAQSANKVKVE